MLSPFRPFFDSFLLWLELKIDSVKSRQSGIYTLEILFSILSFGSLLVVVYARCSVSNKRLQCFGSMRRGQRGNRHELERDVGCIERWHGIRYSDPSFCAAIPTMRCDSHTTRPACICLCMRDPLATLNFFFRRLRCVCALACSNERCAHYTYLSLTLSIHFHSHSHMCTAWHRPETQRWQWCVLYLCMHLLVFSLPLSKRFDSCSCCAPVCVCVCKLVCAHRLGIWNVHFPISRSKLKIAIWKIQKIVTR